MIRRHHSVCTDFVQFFFRIVTRKWKLLCISILIVLIVWLLDTTFMQSKRIILPWMKEEQSNRLSKLSIFSWSSKEVKGNREQLLNDLDAQQFDRVFQSFSSSLKEEEIASFVADVTERDIDVYGLYGTPEWAWDPTGKGMIKRLNTLVEVNKQLPDNKRIKGIVMDVEPYVLDKFDWNDRSLQKSYISGMKHLYEAAKQEHLELIVVVPYFFDTKGYRDVVQTIIREASSEVAVMNYFRDHEVDHLAYEAQVAKAADKPITTIYEFKRPGTDNLIDKNTYFNQGRMAAEENARRLQQHYKNQEIHIAYHDYRAFKEVLNNE